MSEESRPAHDVFLSCSSHDKTFADAACAVLERHRVRCSIALAVVASLIGFVTLGAFIVTSRTRSGEVPGPTPIDKPQVTPPASREKPADVAPKPGTEADSPSPPKQFVNSIGMKLTLIGAGEFMMGSDATDPTADADEFVDNAAGRKEKHRVRITQPFYMAIHEVTRGQFRRFVDVAGYQTEAEKDGNGGYGWNEQTKSFEKNPRYTWRNAGFDQTDDHPVVNVSWNDALAFIAWLSRKEGKTYRLPTEAEWEYACRAGTTTRFSFGDDPVALAAVGNVADRTAKEKYPDWTWAITARDGYVYTAPVGRFRPNAWGLFDMHGNVWEWCSDADAADYYKQSPVDDPRGVDGSARRVDRGGGWSDEPRVVRSASRSGVAPGNRNADLGFRLALVQSAR
jgi:sulfatase modifying factor 1